jgi:hypothetical protein
MKHGSDIDRVLETWMADGPTAIPDRVVDVVAARIGVQRQRRMWPFPGRTNVNPYLKLAAGLAAVLIVAVVAWQLLPLDDRVGNQPSVAPSSPAATSSPAAPSATAVEPVREGVLPGGTYRFKPLASAPSMTLDATVPAGWIGNPSCCLAGPVGESNGPAGIGLAFLAADDIFSDPCHWNVNGSGPRQPGDTKVGPSVDELAAALAASPAYGATTPIDVTIGGFAGKRVDLELPPGECDTLDGNGVYLVFGGREGYIYAQGDGSHWQVSIVDVAGTRLIAALFWYAGTSAADLSAGQAIVDSLVITP